MSGTQDVVAVGGVQKRQNRREERRSSEQSTNQSGSSASYQSCMGSRGYSITP